MGLHRDIDESRVNDFEFDEDPEFLKHKKEVRRMLEDRLERKRLKEELEDEFEDDFDEDFDWSETDLP